MFRLSLYKGGKLIYKNLMITISLLNYIRYLYQMANPKGFQTF